MLWLGAAGHVWSPACACFGPQVLRRFGAAKGCGVLDVLGRCHCFGAAGCSGCSFVENDSCWTAQSCLMLAVHGCLPVHLMVAWLQIRVMIT